jgi:hypothetical protein
MEASPLTLQTRPDTFQPKIAQLYESLFKEEEEIPKSEGFWEEFFLLKPDPSSLRKILGALTADDLLHFQVHTVARKDIFMTGKLIFNRHTLNNSSYVP